MDNTYMSTTLMLSVYELDMHRNMKVFSVKKTVIPYSTRCIYER